MRKPDLDTKYTLFIANLERGSYIKSWTLECDREIGQIFSLHGPECSERK